jgi:hypothetical protein
MGLLFDIADVGFAWFKQGKVVLRGLLLIDLAIIILCPLGDYGFGLALIGISI